jgi:type IV secretory pathway VirB10-like protein
VRLSKNARFRATSAATALLALACGGRPARRPEVPSPNVSASAVAPPPPTGTSSSAAAPRPSSTAAPSASASAPPPKPAASAAAKAPEPRPLGKPGGQIEPEIIQRVIRANFGRFRLCYENGLRNCPNLQGRVAVRFVIDIDGSVKQPRDAGSDHADASVTACVVEAFREIRFPPPEGGTVMVTYPILFSPGG